jgi:molecular chaperone GrpE
MTDDHDRTGSDQPGGGGGVAASARAEQAEAGDAARAQAELAQMEDRYKRALADLENYRKRVSRELEGRLAEGRDSMLRDWLEAVDSVERALRSDHDSAGSDGMRSVLDQMEAILARQGVERIGAAGEPFDPERHEAIEVRTSEDLPDRTVVDVVRSGFAIGGRTLRPALVVVSRRAEPR